MPTKTFVDDSREPATAIAPAEVIIGSLVAIDGQGRALVNFNLGAIVIEQVPALSTQVINANSVGRQVALLFAAGDQRQPVIMGFIHSPLDWVIGQTQDQAATVLHTEVQLDSQTDIFPSPAQFTPVKRAADLDGKRLLFEAEDEVQIKCGEASINLYKDGRVVIRGRNLISRASVVNRILGGSVQVN